MEKAAIRIAMETRKAAIHVALENAGPLAATTANWVQSTVRETSRIDYSLAEIRTGLGRLVKDGFVNVNKRLHSTYYHVE